VRFGRGVVAEAPALLAERGFAAYALLTTERALGQAPLLAEQAEAVLCVPSGPVADAAAAVRDDAGRRPLVALGGGRVVDAAKAIAAADGLLCAAVPTTLAGSALTRIHRLPAGVSGVALVRPSLVVADPALSASQPLRALAASAMNALAHAVESLYAPQRSPVTEMAALRAAELIGHGLAEAEPRRDELGLAAVLAAYAVGATGYSVHHPVCQTLVALAGAAHAPTNAVMLPHSVRLMADRAPQAIGPLAVALGAPAPDPSLAAERVAALAARAGPRRLTELGVAADHIDPALEALAGRPELDETPGGRPDAAALRALIEGAL
jgi:alcohol dehydrogenase class IV